MKLTLTKSVVDNLPHPEKGQAFYYDTKLQGFGVYVMKTAKTYFAEGSVGRKNVRVTIGRHGTYFPDKARDEAREILVRMARGENPNETKAIGITLKQAIESYLKQRTGGQGRQIKDKTKDGYEWLLKTPLSSWAATPISGITETLVRKIHAKITTDSGPTCANNALRLVRATLYFEGVAPNPVEVLAAKGLWNPDKRRTRHVETDTLPEWIKGAEALDRYQRAAILMMVFLGFRKNEVLQMQQKRIRDQAIYLTEDDTKNSQSHSVPIGPYLWERIEPLLDGGKWLLPSRESKTGHIVELRGAMKALGGGCSPHDLRRTFVTALNALEPAPSAFTIKRLMNHMAKPGDVTAGYIQHEEKKLREVITRLESWMVGKT